MSMRVRVCTYVSVGTCVSVQVRVRIHGLCGNSCEYEHCLCGDTCECASECVYTCVCVGCMSV